MKNKVKTSIIVLVLAMLVLCLSSCSPYVSSYTTLGMVKTNTADSFNISFMKLDGTLVYKLQLKRGEESDIYYKAELDGGEINVYYDIYGTKEPLFSLKGDEDIESRGGYVEGGKTIYIIIEATEAESGKISVSVGK